jgi:hypothetical protein
MKTRKISTIEFFLEQCEPQYEFDVGFHKINGIWMRDRVKINGVEPDCRAVDIREMEIIVRRICDFQIVHL